MFDTVRNNKRIVQVFLGLIALTFGVFGVGSYVSEGANTVAQVNDQKISAFELDQALREQEERIRGALGANFDPQILKDPSIKAGVLQNLINERLIGVELEKNKIVTTNAAINDYVHSIPDFQEDGKFSKKQYETVLASQRMSPAQFENDIRINSSRQQLVGALLQSNFASVAQTEAVMRLQAEERTFSERKISAAAFNARIKITPEEIKKYYDDNPKSFETPRQMKAQYVVLSAELVANNMQISEDEIKKIYAENAAQYDTSERRASHILIATGEDAKKARAKAEDVLKEVKANPAKFADLAKQYSDDTGSKETGGDLDFFARGQMVAPFENAAFSLKEGQISELVESQFGFHIIKLTAIKTGKTTSLEAVRADISAQLKRQKALESMAQLTQRFDDLVSGQSNSLQPVADELKLKIVDTDWFSERQNPQNAINLGILNNPKIISALFKNEAIEQKLNTLPEEISPNVWIAARVKEFAPAAVKPFESVKNDIEKSLRQSALAKETKNAGDLLLTRFQAGDDKETWGAAQTVSRMKGARELPANAQTRLFSADATKLPAYIGFEASGGDYVIYKISKVNMPEKFDETLKKALQTQIGNLLGEEDLQAYLTSLRARHKVKISGDALTRELRIVEN